MDKDHKEKAEEIFSHISMMLTEYGDVFPTFILIINGISRPVFIKNSEEMSVLQYIEYIYQVIKKEQPEAFIFICKRWMLVTDKKDPITQLLNNDIIRVEDQENKELYLTLQYMSPNGENEALIAKVESDLIGTLYTKTQNWVSNLFPNIVSEWNQ